MSPDFPEYHGSPRIGDTVHIETRGTCGDAGRDGAAGVLVELPGGNRVWVPLGVAVVVRRPGDAR